MDSRRLVILHTSEGYRQQYWKPTAPGPLTTLPDSLTPLEKHKADLIVMPDLSNVGFGSGASGGHGSYGSVYYGLEPGKVSYKQPKGSTFDQVIAQSFPKDPAAAHPAAARSAGPLASVGARQGGLGPLLLPERAADQPIGNPYQSTWRSSVAAGPRPWPNNSTVDMAAVEKLMLRKKSILDYVGRSLETLQEAPGHRRSKAIDAHHESLRDLEMQLQSAGSGGGGGRKCSPGSAGQMIDVMDGREVPGHPERAPHADGGRAQVRHHQRRHPPAQRFVGQQHQLRLRAGRSAQGDRLQDGRSATTTTWATTRCIGGTDHKRIVDKWMMLQFATLLDRMKAVPEATERCCPTASCCSAITCRTARTTTATTCRGSPPGIAPGPSRPATACRTTSPRTGS